MKTAQHKPLCRKVQISVYEQNLLHGNSEAVVFDQHYMRDLELMMIVASTVSLSLWESENKKQTKTASCYFAYIWVFFFMSSFHLLSILIFSFWHLTFWHSIIWHSRHFRISGVARLWFCVPLLVGSNDLFEREVPWERKKNMRTRHKNDPDIFCYIFGQYTIRKHRRPSSEGMR